MPISQKEALLEKVYHLNEIGIALSAEQNPEALLEKILIGAKQLTSADGGTLYTVTPEKKLHFEIVQTDSLHYALGGTTGKPIPFADLALFIEGKPNERQMVAYAVNHEKTLVVQDAYTEKGFDFSGTKDFDQKTGYKTQSVLTIPIKSNEGEVIAVMQLINCKDPVTNAVVPFSIDDQHLAESLASQAGVALTNQRLIRSLKQLFEAFIQVIASAIDDKSPVTGKHGRRVPVIADMLAKAINEVREGPLKEVKFTDEEIYELGIAAFLHDCGKIVTPVHVVEKGAKLEAIIDRMSLVETRYEVLKYETLLEALEKKLRWYEERAPELHSERKATWEALDAGVEEKLTHQKEELAFLKKCNGKEGRVTEQDATRIQKIGRQQWGSLLAPLLTADEIENLSILSGNLTDKERKIIEHHVVMTLRMLQQLPYPKHLSNVTEIAASHHEWVNGKGYPRGLTGEQMSLRAKILAIADVFEALSAPDRPYKKGLHLSETLQIMQKMCEEGHLDPELFKVFRDQKVYLTYAKAFLAPEQIDIQ